MKIGIIGAMEQEIEQLFDKMEDTKTRTIATRNFHEGKLFGKDIVLVQCGIGKVNAGIVTQSMISEFGVDFVINTGIAGSLDNDLEIGDIVVSTDTAYHDMDVNEFGYPRGQVPGMGMTFFGASEKLLSLVPEREHIKQGSVLTGDQFINSREIKTGMQKDFPTAKCVEMEGAAIGHACYLNQIPFLIVRSISDKADDDADKSFKLNMDLAVERSTEITEEIVRGI